MGVHPQRSVDDAVVNLMLTNDQISDAVIQTNFNDGLIIVQDQRYSGEDNDHNHSHADETDGGMGMGLFGFLFISLLLIVSLVISFRWCCKRMRQYNEFVRGIEEEHERRRQVEEDLWIFTIQHEQQNPRIRYGDSSAQRVRPASELQSRDQKSMDDLPSYEEAIKLPPIPVKETTSHV